MLLDPTKPILVVDPTGDAVPVISSLLARLGSAPVERADNGEAALAFLAAQAASLVISEWAMEPMSGAALLRALRADKKTASLPVMIATGNMKADEALYALGLGADAVAIAPLLPRDFFKKIESIADRPQPAA